MSETKAQAYAAQIRITLPGEGHPTAVAVTLLPTDAVPADGRVKPLADCTLAELQAYAEALEADVWATYEAITLGTLAGDEDVEVTVVISGSTEPLADLSQHVLLPASAEPAASAPAVEPTVFQPEIQPVATEPVAEPTAEAVASEAVASEAVVPEPVIAEPVTSEPEPEPEPAVAIVTQPEPEPEPEPVARPEIPAIVPSKARVRVAGKQLPIGDPTWAAVDILIDEPALRAMQAHALSSLNREVAGVMVGQRPEKQPDGRYLVHVIDTIVAKHTVMQGASVTYTPESWRYLNDTLFERYPDETAVMVGWYHTHPGFGIFLSGMDLFIHQNFFTQIWHIAYVLDPRARTSGFFCWNRQKTRVNPYEFAWPEWAGGSW